MFDPKVAIVVLDDLAVWQKLNVTAFLATGIAGAAPEAMGEPYEDAAGRQHARLLGQPILIFAAGAEGLARAWRVALERELTRLQGNFICYLRYLPELRVPSPRGTLSPAPASGRAQCSTTHQPPRVRSCASGYCRSRPPSAMESPDACPSQVVSQTAAGL